MIGMSQIRKRLIYGILIGAGIGVIGIAITLIWSISVTNSYKQGTNKQYIDKYTTEVVMLNRDVTQGETITDDMLTKARVHRSATPSDLAGHGAVGMIAKYNIPANIPLINSMFGEQIVSVDERIQEISSVMLPSELQEGDYIDIKIKMPSGLEYVVIPQIRVERIFGTTMWLYLNEEELYLLNSATVDTYLNDGATLYGVRYVDPTTQIKIDPQAGDMAKLKLIEKIQEDVNNGTFVLDLPEEVTKETVTTDETVDEDDIVNIDDTDGTVNVEKSKAKNEKVTDKKDKNGKETNKPSKEYINFTDNLADLLLKYAVEYRYYVESYNKIERTYEPSSIIRNHMLTNKYITDEAKKSLIEENRRIIEEKIAEFESSSGDKFETTVSGLEEQIAAQQTLRDSILNGNR